MVHKGNMSQDASRKFFDYKNDPRNFFEVIKASQDDHHAKQREFQIICKKLGHQHNILLTTSNLEIANIYCNISNQLISDLKQHGPHAGKISDKQLDLLRKAYDDHDMSFSDIENNIVTNVEKFYRILLEMGKL